MKFGLHLNVEHRRNSSSVQVFEARLDQVRATRDNGFNTISFGQHYSVSPYPDTPIRFQTVPVLARLAAEAKDMLIATNVLLLPYFNPVEIAEQIATLDIICNGRFAFGVGIGWRAFEFHALGIPIGERVSRFEESLEVIKRLWTEDAVNFHGKYFGLDGISMSLKPLQKPHPPIWVGASSKGAVRRAARVGDTWVLSAHWPMGALQFLAESYREALDEIGKPLPQDRPIIRNFFVAKDRETALKVAGPYLKESYDDFARAGLFKNVLKDNYTSYERWRDDTVIIGDPNDCIEQIARYREKLGVNHLLLRMQWMGMDQAEVLGAIQLVGDKIIPHFSQ